MSLLAGKINIHLKKETQVKDEAEKQIIFWENKRNSNQPGSYEFSKAQTQINFQNERLAKINEGLKLDFINEYDLVAYYDDLKAIFVSFKAMRMAAITETKHTSSIEDEKNKAIQSLKNRNPESFGNKLEQHLVNIKVNQSLALTEDNNQEQAKKFQEWFKSFDNHLKFLFEDETAHLVFYRQNFKFKISLNNREFDFQSLSSGYLAIFEILADLLVRSEFFEITPNELQGIVLIDEIDAHLHISLQKKILPFFTKLFPQIQFIVSTHSPFVITSTNNDTVVYDISSGEFFEEDLSHYSHESIIKELFHVKNENENIKILSDQLLQFINSKNQIQNLSEIQNLIDEINKDFEKLSVELQLQYMVAKNKLAKLRHEGN